MGQYWISVNLDKNEYFSSWELDTGAKLWEQLANPLTSAAWVVLLAAEREERGGGDLEMGEDGSEYAEIARRIVGRWAGDRVAMVGDYAEDSDLLPDDHAASIYQACRGGDGWENITPDLLTVLNHELER